MNLQIIRQLSTALRAGLRGILGRHFNYFATSLFRFEAKYIEELKPCNIPHRFVQAAPATKRRHFLNANRVIRLNQFVRYFKMKVASLVSDFLMRLGYQYARFLSSVRSLDSARESLLPLNQGILGSLEETGIFNPASIRVSQKELASDVYTDCLTGFGQGPQRHIIAGEAHKPFASGPAPNSDGFNIAFNRAGKAELEPAQVSNDEIFAVELPAGLPQSEAVISVLAFKPRKTRLFTVFESAKKALIRSVQSLKDIFKSLSIYFFIFREDLFQFRKLFFLIKYRYGSAALLVSSDPFFKRAVVEISTKIKPMLGFLKYLLRRQKAVLEGFSHLPCTIFRLAQFDTRGNL